LLCGLLAPAFQTFSQPNNPPDQPQSDRSGRSGGGGNRDGRGKGGGGRGGGGNLAADQRGKARGGGHGLTEFHTDVPAHPLDFVLGRPTGNSITLSVLAYQDMEGYVAYGTEAGRYSTETPKQLFKQGQPVEVLMTSLQPDTRYFYRFRSRPPGTDKFSEGEESSFHTARPPGKTFTFVVQADPHLDENVIPERYRQSMLNIRSDRPDFLVDLGDTFMTGKYRDDRQGAEKQYLAQRYYFGVVGQSSSVFLVLGNHDGEGGGRRSSDPDGNSPSVWANLTRKKYFPNPIPDAFYTGNTKPHPAAGLLQDYYAWEWGNGLFVVLDPYWFSAGAARDAGENWNWSLGREQYDWLRRTLEASKSPFKFIFIHHLVGGATPEGRGGLEASFLYEWGGLYKDGSDGFQRNRPGWPAPIHELLVKNGATIVFHGHDHMFAKQDRDGIVYQCVPQPGNTGDGSPPRKAAEFSYVSGKILGSPGYLRVTVAPDKMTAELVHSYQPADETGGRKNRQVSYAYEISAAGNPSPRKPAGL
jgi:predicted phosphodiesterase